MAKLTFIGLGNMGSGMCANLCKAGMDVTAYDLSPAAVNQAVAAGAKPAASAEAAAAGAAMVITMLPAGSHVLDVYFDTGRVAQAAAPGALLIDCSTIAVEDARQAHIKALDAGLTLIDAPVSGGVAAAEAGTLTFMVGGEAADFARAQPVLSAMGKNLFHAGGAGNGQAAKIANNMLLGVSMIATCEAFNLAEKLGLDAQTFFDISSKASGQCWSMTTYCPAPGPVPTAPSNRDYQPGFSVAMMLKDLKLAMGAAAGAQADTDFGKAAEAAYQALADDGHGARDFSVPMLKLKGEL
ncbi:MAG: 3-hydroxyisobutyrate dehydrogenase [Alphaproteobacteria bacterium TMED89]|nr:3-hydroxyisobutyrate dehydrogenase [Rhodospirillaceae bacterium]RPH11771.1 MAG: 3-hydroxyisobutyrate dehydrogenase [Alphaproteobacteria bacterium TMED89]